MSNNRFFEGATPSKRTDNTSTSVRDKIRTKRVALYPQYGILEWPLVCCRRNNMRRAQQ